MYLYNLSLFKTHSVIPSVTIVFISFRYPVDLYLGFLETHSVTLSPGVDGFIVSMAMDSPLYIFLSKFKRVMEILFMGSPHPPPDIFFSPLFFPLTFVSMDVFVLASYGIVY